MNMAQYKAIVEIAVGNEEEAYEFYKNAAQKTKDSSLISIFNELAKEELKHKALLQGYLNDDFNGMVFKEGPDYKIAESLPLPELTSDMKFTDAIVLAMKKEQQAMDMYKSFADASVDQNQKDMFIELAKMEQGHKTRLEDIYNDTAFVEAW